MFVQSEPRLPRATQELCHAADHFAHLTDDGFEIGGHDEQFFVAVLAFVNEWKA
jgi:hypothetical protein